MYLTRTSFIVMFLVFGCCSALAQRPGPEFWRKVSCVPLEPRTKLEALEDKYTSIVLKGFTRITTVEVRGVRVDAIEMREMGNAPRAKGVVIVLRDSGGRVEDN